MLNIKQRKSLSTNESKRHRKALILDRESRALNDIESPITPCPRKPTQSASSGNQYNVIIKEDLGRNIYLIVNKHNGQIYVHIRKHEVVGDNSYPTKFGVFFTPMRWKALVAVLSNVYQALHDHPKEDSDIQYNRHLGGNLHVTVTKKFGCDIRYFWLPDGEQEIKPTRRGVTLNTGQVERIQQLTDQVNNQIPDFDTLELCSESHQNQIGMLRCSECNPDTYQDNDY